MGLFPDLLGFKMPGLTMTITGCLLWASSRYSITSLRMRKTKFKIYIRKHDAELSSMEKICPVYPHGN